VHLESLTLQNFRSFTDTKVPLCPDLTVFVGENNGGKSNAIDAIRLVTSPLSGRRELYCETTDIRSGGAARAFHVEARYAGLNAPQQGRFISAAADETLENAIFGLTYDEGRGRNPVRPSLWAGQQRSVPEPGCHELVRHVYLPPLRDAKRALASGNPTRIHTLLKHFLDDEHPDELARRLRREADEPIFGRVDNAVDLGLKALTSAVRRQVASLSFSNDEKLIDIARDLRFRLADHGLEPEDLRYSGHGYANLLYMATIAVELQKVNDADLTLFLVEEPEAHLHPQLQAAVLCFLESQAEQSKTVPEGHLGKAGQVQVVVATHSPNLSAWVESKDLVFFRSYKSPLPQNDQRVEAVAQPEEVVDVAAAPEQRATEAAAAPPMQRSETRCIPLYQLPIDDEQRRKIDRYLDVTKSAFLFGGRMLLVEGIAEALLLPVIARRFVLHDQPEQFLLFRSTVFVPIDGVDFEPYAHLLLAPHEGVRIADRVVVITDGDGGTVEPGEQIPGVRRKEALEAIARRHDCPAILHVAVSTYSLESELVAAGNEDVMKAVYLQLHPRSEVKWTEAIAETPRQRAIAIQALFENTRKGDFAQVLAEKILAAEAFNVPAYISDGILAVVG